MLSETSITTTPLRPPGVSSLLRGSSVRADAIAAVSRPSASTTSAVRMTPVRTRALRKAGASGVGTARERLRGNAIGPLQHRAEACGERARLVALRGVLRPGERPGALGEVVLAPPLDLFGDELERTP